MRRFGEVQFPEAILAAQRDGRLVIFAGAGVSMPSPSDLPSFWKLAEILAAGTETPVEPLDQFLGRLPPHLKIHERTQAILTGSASQPNTLHRDLLRVFLRSQRVRLVTTNFDEHFSAAAEEVFAGESPEIFSAPALPVGSNFSGIVHIHGSVAKDSSRLVLTDQDFGRGYLTEGWARRFIQDVFLNYVVLFVGYSHNDPVMHHLARGLPPVVSSNRRFVLTPEDKHDSWANLGITDLIYPLRSGNDHSALQTAITAWASSIVATPIETRERVRKIVARPPEPTGEDITFIEACLGNLPELRFFSEFASSLEWLHWIQERDAFRRLLSNNVSLTESDEVLALWFAQHYACDHPGTALDLIRQNQSSLPVLMWRAIADTIWRRMLRKHYPLLLDKWVALLIEQHHGRHGVQILSYIAKDCRLPEDDNTLYLLLRHLLQPVMQLESSLSNKILNPGSEPDVDPDIEVRGDTTWLGQVWSRIKSHHLGSFAYRLWPVASMYIEQATAIFKAFDKSGDSWDPISFNLERIDQPSISLSNNGLAILVDIACTCFEWFVTEAPEQAEACVVTWWNGDCLTLKRLAVWELARLRSWSNDTKIAWLLEKRIIRNPVYRKEFTPILMDAFPGLDARRKKTVVGEIAQHFAAGIDDLRSRDYAIHSLLVKLQKADPAEKVLRKEIHALEVRTPELIPRPETIDDSQRGVDDAQKPALTEKDFFSSPVTTMVDRLADPLDGATGPQRRAILSVFGDAVREDPQWGVNVAMELVARSIWETDLWSTLVSGFNTRSLTPIQWEKILNLLADQPIISSLTSYETVALLEQGIRSESHGIGDQLLPASMRVAEQVWQHLEAQPGRSITESKEWLSISINDSAGILMQFEVRVLARLRTLEGDSWTGLTPGLRKHFNSVLESPSWSGEMARVLLASQVQVFFHVDPAWTKSEMFKIFDWKCDGKRAQQAWQGYLFWGQWTNLFLEEFLRYYVDTIAHIETDLGRTRDSFSEHLAAIAVFGSIPPLSNGWLWTFVRHAPEKDRSHWAHQVAMQLKNVAAAQKKLLWDGWIKDYWQTRLIGPYPDFSSGEVGAMILWSLNMTPVFPEVVSLLLRSTSPLTFSSYVGMTMKDSEVLITFPKESADLLAHLMRNASLEYDDPIFEMVRELAPRLTDRTGLIKVCEELTRQGSPGAGELKTFVENSPKPGGM